MYSQDKYVPSTYLLFQEIIQMLHEILTTI